MRNHPLAPSRIVLALVLATTAACGGDASSPAEAIVARVTVEPASATIMAGATTQLSATVRDAQGTALSGYSPIWSSSNSQVATVSSSGVVTGVAAGGPVTISATCEGKSGSAQVTVTAHVATVSVTPATKELAPGSTVQLDAITRDDQGHVLTGRTITWQSSAEAVAVVSESGLVTAVAPGAPVTITATSEGKSGTALVTVLGPVALVTVSPDSLRIPVGAEVQLTVALHDAQGNVLVFPAVSWTSSDATVATVSAAGYLTALVSGGPVTITATSPGVSGTARVTVLPVLSLSLASGTSVLDAKLYQPGDGAVHPTVVLLSAILRDAAENADIAAGVVAEGWNALMFDFRGSFGSTGAYALENSLTDIVNVVAILRSPAAGNWGVDANRIVLLGRGEGGWYALMGAARDGAIACVGGLSPMNIGVLGREAEADPALKAQLIEDLRPATEGANPTYRLATTLEEFAEDMITNADAYDLELQAPQLTNLQVLLVGASLDQSYTFYEQARLVDALRAAGATMLTTDILEDNHRFLEHRPALVQLVTSWLRDGCGR